MKIDQEMNSARKLKADLHLHTQEDPKDKIKYTAKQLIDEAWRQKFDVLAINNHNMVSYDDYLKKYAVDSSIGSENQKKLKYLKGIQGAPELNDYSFIVSQNQIGKC